MKYRYKTLDRKEKYKMKIAVAGTGYVGLSNAILLSQNNQVYAVDIIQEKVEMINRKESPDRKSTRLNSSHLKLSRMPSSA